MEGSRTPAPRRGRLLDACVLAGVAWTAGVLLAARFGPVAAVLGGLAVLLLLRALLRPTRRRPLLRRLVVALVLALLVLGGWRSIDRARLRPPGPVEPGGESAVVPPAPFRAGLAAVPFDLPARTTLAGWGQRPRRASLPAYAGLGDVGRLSLRWMGPPAPGAPPRVPVFRRPSEAGAPVGARALVLAPDAGAPFGLVRLDLVYVDAETAAAVLAGVRELGFSPETLLVQASHTHSGPGGVLCAPLAEALGTDHFDPAVRDAVVAAAVAAIRAAHAEGRPARLVPVRASDRGEDGLPRLVRTRGRHADEDPAGDASRIDPRVLGLRFEDLETGAPIALLVHYAVQPVMLRPRHLQFGPDLPGAIEAALEARLAGRPAVLFANGHLADVTPRRDGLGGPEGAALLAARFAAGIAPALEAGDPPRTRLAVRAVRRVRDLGTPHAVVALGARRAFARHVVGTPFGRDAPQAFAAALCLPPNALLGALGLPEVRVGFTFDGAAGAVVNLEGAIGPPGAAAGAVLLETEAGVDAALLWHPGVGTQALLAKWREATIARALPLPFVLGTTNGAVGYLVTAEEYAAGRYEALASLHGPDGAARIEAMLLDALEAARPGPGA